MATQLTTVGDLMPDQPDRDNPGMERAINVLPALKSYRPVRDLVPETNALAEYCRGALVYVDDNGDTGNIAGDRTTIYRRVDNTYAVDTTAYNLATEDNWEFLNFPVTKRLLAANGNDKIQESPYGGGFIPIAAAPNPRHIASIRNFVVAGNMPTDRNLIAWSALGDHTQWTPGTQQSGQQILADGGEITHITNGEYGVIFMEHAIYRMTYVGPPLIFQFDRIMGGRGTTAPKSVVTIGHRHWFLDADGFYMFDGGNVQPVSNVKFTRWFLDRYDANFSYKVTAAADIQNSLIYWAYPTKNAVPPIGLPNEIVVYNWLTDRWAGPIQLNAELLTISRVPSVLTDTSPYPGDEISDTIDTPSDSRIWAGGNASLGAFNTFHELSGFSGPVLTALLESGEISANLGGHSFVTGVRPIVDGDNTTSIQMRVGKRNITYGNVTYTPLIAINTQTGQSDVRVDGRYHRYQMEVSGNYEHIYGVELEYVGAGRK